MLTKVTVIGSGSWATALVKIFTGCGIHVGWMVRNDDTACFVRMNGHNPRYLSFAKLDTSLVDPTTDTAAALDGSELAVFAVPSAFLTNTARMINPELLHNKDIAVSIKGFVHDTGWLPSVFLEKQFESANGLVVFGGPCHAEEVAMEKPTYFTVSSNRHDVADKLAQRLSVSYLRTVRNYDPAGVEYSAILKNIIGIATGIARGLNYGDNFQAVLVSNAMRETRELLELINPAERDLFNSSYFGDLLVTAYSDHSRNHTLGKLVGRGLNVNRAIQAMEMIAEGFHASRELDTNLRTLDISLPVFNAVHRVLHRQASPASEFRLLEKHLI
jgi:glycerol-3-phosphate dehydrogenase (NAD(P)+)